MKKDKNEIIEALSDIDVISGKIHKISEDLQALETALYTIQQKIYLIAAGPQKERK